MYSASYSNVRTNSISSLPDLLTHWRRSMIFRNRYLKKNFWRTKAGSYLNIHHAMTTKSFLFSPRKGITGLLSFQFLSKQGNRIILPLLQPLGTRLIEPIQTLNFQLPLQLTNIIPCFHRSFLNHFAFYYCRSLSSIGWVSVSVTGCSKKTFSRHQNLDCLWYVSVIYQ